MLASWVRRRLVAVREDRRPSDKGATDRGTAVLEFVVLAVVVIVPIAYAIAVVVHLQAAAFGSVTAAREAARAYVTADTTAQGAARARTAAAMAMADQGLPAPTVTIRCLDGACLSPGSRVRVEVLSRVEVPFVPTRSDSVGGTIPVSAVHESVVDTYRADQ